MGKQNKIAILNILSTILLQGIVFFTTPIFTRMLGSSQFGLYSVFHSWVLIFTCVMGFSVNSALGTGLYEFRQNYLKFRSSVLLFGTIICVVEVFLMILFRNELAIMLGYNSWLVVMMGVTAFSQFVINYAQSSFIYEKKAEINFALSVFLAVFSVLLSIFLIMQCDKSVKYVARIKGIAITYGIVAFVVWLFIFCKKPTNLNKIYCEYAIKFGFPIVFHSLAHNVLSQSDRVMMQMMAVSSAEIGIYSLYYSMSSALGTLLNALNTTWCPFYFDDIDGKRWENLYKKSKNYIELFTVLTVGFLLLSREVSYLMGNQEYWKGINVLPIIVVSVYFTFMYQFPVNYEFFYKKTKVIAAGTVGSALLNIVLNALFIPLWGMYGAAIATALSYLALFFLHYFIVTHMKNGHFHLHISVFLPGIIMVLGGTIAFYVLGSWWSIRWGLGAIIGVLELSRIWKRKSIF